MFLDLITFEKVLKAGILDSDKIIIAPHVFPDFDAIGSAIGIARICNHFGKEAHILVNEKLTDIDYKVAEVIQEASNDYSFINMEKYKEIKGDNDLLITTDVNKSNIVELERNLDDFKDIMIIDHHQTDDKTIRTKPKNMYVNVYSSSASEIVTNIILDYKINIDSKTATYLYSGIVLDTNRFMKNTSSQTMINAAELLKMGANIERTNYLLKCNNIQNLKIYKLVNNTKFCDYSFGIAGIAKEDRQIYDRKEIAIAADKIIDGEFAFNENFKVRSMENLNAAFTIGSIDKNNYHISARSTENGLDVCEVMRKIGGGGNMRSAAAEIPKRGSYKVLTKLRNVIKSQ